MVINFLSCHLTLPDELEEILLQLGGQPILIRLARGELRDKNMVRAEEEEGKEHDRRVEYEAARILVRLSRRGGMEPSEWLNLLSADCAKELAKHSEIFMLLLDSKFDILQAEAMRALSTMADIGMFHYFPG